MVPMGFLGSSGHGICCEGICSEGEADDAEDGTRN